MSKRKGSKRKGSKGREADQASEAKLSHNPFGALAGLGESLPPGEPPREATQRAEPIEVERFPKKIVVRMEKKGRRGKTVTRIAGIPGKEIESLAIEIKKALGCGAMVEGPELVLQGSLVDRAVEWLEKQGARQLVKGN